MGDQTQAYDIFQTPLSSGYPLPLRTETKGNLVTIPNNVTQVILFIVKLNSSLRVTLYVKSAKRIMFH